MILQHAKLPGQVVDSKCDIAEEPDVKVTITAEISLIDCALDFRPDKLNEHGKNTHKVVIKDCVLVDERGKVFIINMAHVDLATVRLDICAKWPECLEDPVNFILFQEAGLSPQGKNLRRVGPLSWLLDWFLGRYFNELELFSQEQELFNRVCKTPTRTVAVLAQLGSGAKAIALNKSTVDVGGAFIRGLERVVCLPKGRGKK